MRIPQVAVLASTSAWQNPLFACSIAVSHELKLWLKNRMSDTTDSTEQLPTVPGSDGYAPSVDDGNEMTLLMYKDFAQEVASNKDGTMPNPERNKDSVFESVLQSMKDSVGASFAQQPAAPEAQRSPGLAGSSIMGMLEVIERNFTKNLAEPPLAEDEVEIGYRRVTQESRRTPT